MLEHKRAFSGFSVDDVAIAKAFYGGTLGLTVTDGPMGNLDLSLGDSASVFIYRSRTTSRQLHDPQFRRR